MDKDSRLRLLSGNSMPLIGFGTWQLGSDVASKVETAIKLGFRMIDTSGDYGTQSGVGQGVKNSDIPRDELFIITKIEEDDDAYQASRHNLEELGLDYVDLMLIHRPAPTRSLNQLLWQDLIRAKRDGMAKDIGVSNFSTEQMQNLAEHTGEIPVVNQIEWSPFGFSAEMHDFCRRQGIVIQAYSPLTRGERMDQEVVADIADKYEVSEAQILLRWSIQMGVVPIVKASQREHMQEDIEVFDFELDREDMVRLAGLNEEFSVLSGKPVYMRQ